MSLSTVEEVLEKLQTTLLDQNLTTIIVNWDESFVTIDYNSEQSIVLIEKEFYDDSKRVFLEELINGIKKFSLLYIHAAIKVCDSELPIGNSLYESQSCETLYAKVCELTGLSKLRIYELNLPLHAAELYFFVRPENLPESLARLLIISGSFNTAAINTLYAEMMSASETLENVSFIGKVGSSDHTILKRVVHLVVKNLLNHIKQQQYKEDGYIESTQIGIIDLTTMMVVEDHFEVADEIFYDFNTSDIMETDYPLSHYYDPEIKGLREGWDVTVDKKKYEDATFDAVSMFKYLDNSINVKNKYPDERCDKNADVEILEYPKSDDDLQVVSVSHGERREKWKLRDRKDGRYQPPSTRMSLSRNGFTSKKIKSNLFNDDEIEEYQPPSTRMSSNRNGFPSKKIKSNLFNDDEVEKWGKSRGPDDMSKILSSASKDYKNLSESLNKDYKIPRKSYNGPSPRPSIHNTAKDSKSYKQETRKDPKLLDIFQRHVEMIAPYESPSVQRQCERNTPESVSKFINLEPITVIDDDDDNNNLSTSDNKPLQKVPARRKLLNISPKIFKNRRHDYSLSDSPFSSNISSRKNSSSRRNI